MVMASGGRLWGAILLVVGIFAGFWLADRVGFETTSPVTVPVEVLNTGELAEAVRTAAPAVAPAPPAAPAAQPAEDTSSSILTLAIAEGWCEGGCPGRFEALEEANGAENPRGVHLKTGNPVKINLPAGFNGQVWDCFNASQVTGPANLPQVCEASFRMN